MDTPELLVEQTGPVLTVTFNRPRQHNAMTFDMYDALHAACERADADDTVRVMVLRGAGARAFVAGTDIAEFAGFRTGEDGVAYEQRITRVVNRLEDVTVPTVAAVRGFCMGGGLAIAAVCDLRLAAPSARFGVPIAKTLGNCLSMNTYSLLVQHLGPARTLDMLLRARVLSVEEAQAAGFVAEVCAAGGSDDAHDADAADAQAGDGLGKAVDETVATLLSHAPLTLWAAKESAARLRRATLPDGDDIVARVFGSDDFHRAVQAFGSRQPVQWSGR